LLRLPQEGQIAILEHMLKKYSHTPRTKKELGPLATRKGKFALGALAVAKAKGKAKPKAYKPPAPSRFPPTAPKVPNKEASPTASKAAALKASSTAPKAAPPKAAAPPATGKDKGKKTKP